MFSFVQFKIYSSRVHYVERSGEIILNFGPVAQEMSFKDISYLQLWWPFYSAVKNGLCNFGRGPFL